MPEITIDFSQVGATELTEDMALVQAFRPGGPLADSGAASREQEGVMQLFRGAHLAYRNPASHRDVGYSDLAEVAEVILLANLLLRLTARAAARSAATMTT